MTDEKIQDLAKLEAPFGREIICQDVVHESGLRMLRIRIREGKRFTILDIDPATAANWSQIMETWSEQAERSKTGN